MVAFSFVVTWVVLCVGAHPMGGADDWPQFRGPGGDGVSRGAALPLTWSESQNVLWKVRTAGRGRSSPVVLGDRIWLAIAYETPEAPEKARERLRGHPQRHDMDICADVRLCVLCLDRASGKQIYEAELFRVDQPDPAHKLNSFATPTPVAEPGRLYCDFGEMGTACVEAETGKVLWKQRLGVYHMVGPGSSPVLYKDLLMLVRDGCDKQYVAALDKQTGQTVWKADRPPIEAPPDARKAFSTPLVIQADGATQMIVPGAHWVVSYDPATGREIWRVRHGKGFSLAPRPVYGQGMVYICTGCHVAQLWAIRVDGRGDVTNTHVVWKATEEIPIMSSPLLVGREIYSVSDRGIVFCLDALTGKVHWRYRAPGTYLASPLYADGRVYFFNRDGKTTVLRAGTELEMLAENQLEGSVTASPAVAGNAILLRTDSHLYCIGKR